ncbi:MAG: hypothetical protein J6T28_11760 [Paludibacteraceae bacterium]|nr:hypothetical protein [Paludibacteraceae bacterium]
MNKIILKPRSDCAYSLPEIKEGDVLMHFAPYIPDTAKKVRYVESNKDKFEIYTEPHWIECGLMEKGLIGDLDMINEHADEISRYDSLEEYRCVREKRIKKKDFDYIGTGGRRLIYTLYRNLKNDPFLEINTTGLSFPSMLSLFDYVLDTHDKYPTTSYLFIQHVDELFYKTIETPTIAITKENEKDIITIFESFFAYNKKISQQELASRENSPQKNIFWKRLRYQKIYLTLRSIFKH